MKVKLIMAAVIADCLMATAIAEVSVTGIKVQPRSPWNGLVDVEYTVACDDIAADVYINPVVYDGDRRITMFPSSFTGEGWESPVKAGKHKLVWDAKRDFGAYSCANFQFKIYAGTRLAKYVKIDLSSGSESDNYPVTLSSVGPDVTKDECRTTELWLRLVLPGEFWLGSPKDEVGRNDSEILHHVTFTKPFYIGVFEVTQKQWELVMGVNPSYFKEVADWAVRPVESMDYRALRGFQGRPYSSDSYRYVPDTSEVESGCFISRLRARSGNSSLDLPSSARWEYACRAGVMTALPTGKDILGVETCANVAEMAWYAGNRTGQDAAPSSVNVGSVRVGKLEPNSLGLYDMIGNVAELCRDFPSQYGDEVELLDPWVLGGWVNQPKNLDWKMIGRGGSWKSTANECRSGYRGWYRVVEYYNQYRMNTWNVLGVRLCAEVGF